MTAQPSQPVKAPPPPGREALEALARALADLSYDVAVARMNEQEAKSA